MISTDMNSFFFDGKSEHVLEVIRRGRHKIKKLSPDKKENITIVREPGSTFLSFVSTPTGRAEVITTHILSYLESYHIPLDKLIAIGCDGASARHCASS